MSLFFSRGTTCHTTGADNCGTLSLVKRKKTPPARFRTVFFKNSQNLARKKRQANLEAKLVLIKEVEDLATLENPHWFKDDVREAQVKWRAVGYIPREKMDEVNDRFRTACDKILRAEG